MVVFFPTEKATRFGFLIQGPYKTTPSRDNIPKDDDWNVTLARETAALIAETLRNLKEMGLLTVTLLEALPIRMEDFPEDSMFYPIVSAVRDALMNEALLPADDGTFASARNAKLARGAELRKLLNQDQLRSLFQSTDTIKWLAGEITQDRTPDLRTYLMNELDVEEVTPDGFVREISDSFLASQTDDWVAAFYEYLSDQEALWRSPRWSSDTGGILRSKPILRLEDGSLVVPFGAVGHPNAYLPPEHSVTFPVVRRSITKHKAASDFLKRLGLAEPDEVADVIENILPKYRKNGEGQLDDESYQADLKAIFRALKTDSQQKQQRLLEEAQKTPFVKSINVATDEAAFKKPREVYLPTEDMLVYLTGNQAAWIADGLTHKEHREGAMQLGLAAEVRVNCCKAYPDGNIELENRHGWHERGLRGFDPKVQIDGLEYALSNPSPERSRFIWNSVLIPNMHLLKGFVEKATRQDYSNSRREEGFSVAGKLVVENAWIIGRDGVFHMPSEIALTDLPEDYVRNEGLARQLGMNLSHTQNDHDNLERAAEVLGVRPEYLELARNNPEEFAKWCEEVKCRSTTRPSFPMKPVRDPERRQERLSVQLATAPEKEYDSRDRNVRTTRGTVDPKLWLRSQYTNEEDQMVCQICKEEMPFRKRDGEYYFEAVEALSKSHFSREYEAQFLALCPLCAARYKEFVKQDDSAMEVLKNVLVNSERPEVSLILGEVETSIRFVESHWQDVRTILNDELTKRSI